MKAWERKKVISDNCKFQCLVTAARELSFEIVARQDEDFYSCTENTIFRLAGLRTSHSMSEALD